jgi:phenylacetate-CoA ligase
MPTADPERLADLSRPYWDEEAQTMPREKIRALQDERLRDAVRRAYEHAPFFRRRFDEAGITPDTFNGLDDLHRLPIFDKNDLRADEAAHPPLGSYRSASLREITRMAASTGTSGRPTIALWTARDLALDFELSARANWRLGLRPGHIVVNAHPGYTNGGESFIAGDCRYMGMLPISLGPPTSVEEAARALRVVEGLPVDKWRLFPSAMQRFREAAEAYDIKVELPEPELTGPLSQYEKLSGGQECISVIGGTCGPGKGAHLAEDYAIVEVLDVHTLEPVADGERGLLVVTSLGRDNPMIRYNLEDIVRVDSTPCDCGETSWRGFFEGRRKDIVFVNGKLVLPIDVWLELPTESEFVLVRRPDAERLTVRVEHDPPCSLADRLTARIGVPVDVEQVPVGSLRRAAYKPERVADEPTAPATVQ